MRVILAGPDPEDLTRAAYPAFAAAGVDVEAIAGSPEQTADFARAVPDAALVVDAAVFPGPDQALEALRALPNPKVVILPPGWGAHQTEFGTLPGLVAGFTAPASWPEVVAQVRAVTPTLVSPVSGPPPVPSPKPAAAVDVPAPQPGGGAAAGGGEAGARRRARVGFWGTRGGCGVSTAALTAARLLADAGHRVLLCDATGRGDLHLMLGVEPQEGTIRIGENLFVRLGLPDGEAGNASIVIDGGRSRRNFNAEWVEISKPLPEERIRRIVGLPAPKGREIGPSAQTGQEKRGKARIGFIRLEVTD